MTLRHDMALKEVEVVQHLFNFSLFVLWRKMELDDCNAKDFNGEVNFEPLL